MKDLKISKELIKAVLEIDIKDVSIIGSTLNYTILNHETEEDGELVYIDLGQNINIYEFSFKCKEWVNKQGYWANSGYDNKYYCMLRDMPDNQWFYADTEVETIVKACEWILKEIKDK